MKKTLVYVILLVHLLSGCDAGYMRNSAGISEHQSVIGIARTAVPHIGDLSMRLDYVELLETDDYGRKLYRYNMGETWVGMILIEQKADDVYTYYYEDLCYVMYRRGERDATNEEIAWLKENNDWDKPLDDTKIHGTPIGSGSDNLVDSKKVSSAVRETLVAKYPGQDVDITINGLEIDEDGSQLIFGYLYFNKTGEHMYYLLSYSMHGAVVLQETSLETLREDIIACKNKD